VELHLYFTLYPCGIMINKPRDTYVFTKIVISLEAQYQLQYHGTRCYSNPQNLASHGNEHFVISSILLLSRKFLYILTYLLHGAESFLRS